MPNWIRNKVTFDGSIKDIEINEEILVFYGGVEYWNDNRQHINIK